MEESGVLVIVCEALPMEDDEDVTLRISLDGSLYSVNGLVSLPLEDGVADVKPSAPKVSAEGVLPFVSLWATTCLVQVSTPALSRCLRRAALVP